MPGKFLSRRHIVCLFLFLFFFSCFFFFYLIFSQEHALTFHANCLLIMETICIKCQTCYEGLGGGGRGNNKFR